MNKLIDEIIAEIKRDIDMDNLMALQETLAILLQNADNKHTLTRYLSEFPDMKRLNRILIEELNKQNIKLPEGEHNDYIEFNTRDSAAF